MAIRDDYKQYIQQDVYNKMLKDLAAEIYRTGSTMEGSEEDKKLIERLLKEQGINVHSGNPDTTSARNLIMAMAREDIKNGKMKIYVDNYTSGKDVVTGESNPLPEDQQQVVDYLNVLQNTFQNIGLTPQSITPTYNEQGLTSDYQLLLDLQNQAANEQYAAQLQELSRAESDMYRAIGLSQRQMERDIAKRRQQALKSGMSTAQLAAQEQQNILAAQTGAAQIAQTYADQRYGVINQFAGASAQNYANTLAEQMQYTQGLQQFNAQQQANWANTLASTYATMFAAKEYGKAYEDINK